jgi:hypothetical protein
VTRSALIVVAAALLLGGTSLTSAKTKGAAGAHSKPSRPSINEITPNPSIDETTPRATVADFFNFYALPPYSPGNAYRYVRPAGRP